MLSRILRCAATQHTRYIAAPCSAAHAHRYLTSIAKSSSKPDETAADQFPTLETVLQGLGATQGGNGGQQTGGVQKTPKEPHGGPNVGPTAQETEGKDSASQNADESQNVDATNKAHKAKTVQTGSKDAKGATPRRTRSALRRARRAARKKAETSKARIRKVVTDSPARIRKIASRVPQDASDVALASADMRILSAADVDFKLLDISRPEIPGLAHGLDRVLFKPGVYPLQDPRSRVYNFDPYLEKILPPEDFDFAALSEYKPASADPALDEVAVQHGVKYRTSTSNITSVLQHFHYLLSQRRPLVFDMLSKGFDVAGDDFTTLTKAPVAIYLRKTENGYAIDKDQEYATGHILSLVGKSMEKLLTAPREEFERYRLSNHNRAVPEVENQGYHYSVSDKMMVRSQLDAYDPRIPRTGMFDIKTRAVLSVRMDKGPQLDVARGYQIVNRLGAFESFEREFFDMVRSTMLKYSLQARLGHMDGIFCAFHNLDRIFGFQYISLEEMDSALHGQEDTTLGDQELKLSMRLLQEVLDRVVERFPDQHIRLHFSTQGSQTPSLQIFGEPVTEAQIAEIQGAAARRVREFERSILEPKQPLAEPSTSNSDDADTEATAQIAPNDLKNDAAGAVADIANGMDQSVHSSLEDVRQRVFGVALVIENLSVTSLSLYGHLQRQITGGNEKTMLGILNMTEKAAKTLQALAAEIPTIDWPLDLIDVVSQIEEAVEKLAELVEKQKTKNARLMFRLSKDPDVETETLPTKPETVPVLEDNIDHDKAEQQALHKQSRAVMEDVVLLRRLIVESGAKKVESAQELTKETSQQEDIQDSQPKSSKTSPKQAQKDDRELLALKLAIRNRIDGKHVQRPKNFSSSQSWQVEYALQEITESAWEKYEATLKRRLKAEQKEMGEEKLRIWYNIPFMRTIMQFSKKGRAWRERQDEIDAQKEKVVFESNEEKWRKGNGMKGQAHVRS